MAEESGDLRARLEFPAPRSLANSCALSQGAYVALVQMSDVCTKFCFVFQFQPSCKCRSNTTLAEVVRELGKSLAIQAESEHWCNQQVGPFAGTVGPGRHATSCTHRFFGENNLFTSAGYSGAECWHRMHGWQGQKNVVLGIVF